jgi:hypothetical protein
MEAHRVVRRRDSHIFYTIVSQMAARLSALNAGRLFAPGRFLVLISVRDWVDSNELIGNRTSELPTCSFQTVSICDSTILLLDLRRSFSFLILYTFGRTPWTGDQPITRPLPTHRINEHRHPCIEWDSNPRSHCDRQFPEWKNNLKPR